MTFLDFTREPGIGAYIGTNKTTPEQFAQWDFGNFFVPFGPPKMIVVDADGIFVMPKKPFQDNLIMLVHEVSRVKHKYSRE